MAENLGHKFVHLAGKIEDGYQIFSDLVKRKLKKIGMIRNTMSDLLFMLYPYINANQKRANTAQVPFKQLISIGVENIISGFSK